MAHEFRKIGVLHHISGGNLGDDATLAALVDNLKMRWPEAEITGICMVKSDLRDGASNSVLRRMHWPYRHEDGAETVLSLSNKVKLGVAKHPYLFKLLKAIYAVMVAAPRCVVKEVSFLAGAFRAVRSLDLLVLNAGGQIAETYGKPRAFRRLSVIFPFTISKWVLLGRLAGVKTVVLNLSMQRLASPVHKALLRVALSLADGVSLRDEESESIARRLGLDGKARAFPDTLYSRDLSALASNREAGQIVVGLAPMAFGPTVSREDQARFTRFIEQVGLFASWLIRNGHCATLFCTDIAIDPPSLCAVERVVRASVDLEEGKCRGNLRRVHQWSAEELVANMSGMDYVVTSRFHGVVLAHMLNKPVIALSPHPTVASLMDELGLSRYCLDARNCDSRSLAEAFTSLVENREDIQHRMAARLAAYREKIGQQLDQLFPYEKRVQLGRAGSVAAPLLLALVSLLNCGAAGDLLGMNAISGLAELL